MKAIDLTKSIENYCQKLDKNEDLSENIGERYLELT